MASDGQVGEQPNTAKLGLAKRHTILGPLCNPSKPVSFSSFIFEKELTYSLKCDLSQHAVWIVKFKKLFLFKETST